MSNKYGNDLYSENSVKLNKQNNDKLYNDLLILQTQDNINKNRKTGFKAIPAYDNGKYLYANTEHNVATKNIEYEHIVLKFKYSFIMLSFFISAFNY